MARGGNWRRLAAAALTLGLVASCGGGGATPLSDRGDLPPKVKGPPTEVEVCDLLPGIDIAQVLGRTVEVVGVEYGAAQVPTYRCMLGEEFGVPLVRIELATGPIAENVFFDAYGDDAGGDPELVRKLGDYAYVRNEKDLLTLHVLVHGSIVSLQIQTDPAQPVQRKQGIELASRAVDRLPTNPVLATTSTGPACSGVSTDAVTSAIGADPGLAAHLAGPDDSVMCSWASSPGSATVTIVRSHEAVARYRQNLDEDLYVGIDVPRAGRLQVFSREDRAGDLTVFDGSRLMVFISVVPSAGFADGRVVTTPGEVELATSVVDTLL